jgi:hypothetical protein
MNTKTQQNWREGSECRVKNICRNNVYNDAQTKKGIQKVRVRVCYIHVYYFSINVQQNSSGQTLSFCT